MQRRSKTVFTLAGIVLIVAGLGFVSAADDTETADDTPIAEGTLWEVKAVFPDGELLDVMAVGADGELYDVMAIENEENPYFLDVKAIVDGDVHDVKIVASKDRYAPVMALDIHGTNLDLRAVGAEGKQYDVKGIRRSGNIIRIRAIGVARFHPLQAIAPDGRAYDVKGVKMMRQRVELVIGATQIHAHVKAFPPKAQGSE